MLPMAYTYIRICDFLPRSQAPPQTCARSGRTTVPWPCPGCPCRARHAPLLHPTLAPRPPGASGYMHSSRQHHAAAKQLAHRRPLGGAQPRGACKATHCARSWQGLPRLTAHAANAWMTDTAPLHCDAGGSGHPGAADTHRCARLTAHLRPWRTHSASSVAARAWH